MHFILLSLQLFLCGLELEGKIDLGLEQVAKKDHVASDIMYWQIREIQAFQLELFDRFNSGRPNEQNGAKLGVNDGDHLTAKLEWLFALLAGSLHLQNERVVYAMSYGVVVEGPDGSKEGEVVSDLLFLVDCIRQKTRHGGSQVVDGQLRVKDDVERETDLKEAFGDGPIRVVVHMPVP